MQWNFSVQRELDHRHGGRSSPTLEATDSNLTFPIDLNQVPQSQLVVERFGNFVRIRIYQSISGSTNNAISNYNSLQASVTKRMTNGLSLSFNYVWSHLLDD